MTISKRSERIIWVSAGGRCSLCREPLLAGVEAPEFIGEVAHIVAVSPDGPRGDKDKSPELVDNPNNLMLLCPTCHEEVDKRADFFTTEVLSERKRLHEAWVQKMLAAAPQWTPNKIQPAYIHIPRLAILAAQSQLNFNIPIEGKNDLHSLGPELLRVIKETEDVLRLIKPHAINFSQLTGADDYFVGALVSMGNTLFRTKNCYFSDGDDSRRAIKTWRQAPHIYHRRDGFTLVLSIDPKWITTTSAFTWFRSGQWRFAGLFYITNVDQEEKLIFGTQLFIGTESLF